MRGSGALPLRRAPRPEKRTSFGQGRTGKPVRQVAGICKARAECRGKRVHAHQRPWIRPKAHGAWGHAERRGSAETRSGSALAQPLRRIEARSPGGRDGRQARPAKAGGAVAGRQRQPAANRCWERTHLSTLPAALRTSAPSAAHVAGVGRAIFLVDGSRFSLRIFFALQPNLCHNVFTPAALLPAGSDAIFRRQSCSPFSTVIHNKVCICTGRLCLVRLLFASIRDTKNEHHHNWMKLGHHRLQSRARSARQR